MRTRSKRKNLYLVRYNSDPRLIVDDHLSDIVFLTDTSTKAFTELDEAVRFLCECTNAITTIEELVPELENRIKFDYILPESHIRPKHQLMAMSDMEEKFINTQEDWSRF